MDKLVLDQIIEKFTNKKHIYGAVFYVSSGDNSIDLVSASGEMTEETQYYIASINKLFVSAIILRLNSQNKLDLNDKISKYLSEKMISDLHIYNGHDYSYDITINHLISQTSGLPCYLIDPQPSGKKVMSDLEAGVDQPWPIEKVIREVKNMKTHFPPGQKGKANYIDTNHQILSLIVENINNEQIDSVLNSLFRELDLNSTYVYDESNNGSEISVYYKSKRIRLPLFLSSTRNDIISTVRDQMKFLKSFFNGYFFPKEKLKELEKWNNIFFPFKYGIGIQKFQIPRLLTLFKPIPAMIGHSGSTGSVAFYIPDKDIYITGTINQQAKPSTAFQTMIKILNNIK
jgi:CubicO group peptidase (beta-lactamase class C family)